MSEKINDLWFPRHNAGLTICHNRHRNFYESVDEFVNADAWVSDEERAKAIKNDELWEIQWYPDTPVGFYALAASSLSALRRAVEEMSE